MSIETSANEIGVREESTVPELRTFQTLDSSIGRVSENVNLFRGNVTLALPLLTLASRGGLEVDVSISYQSDIQWEVGTWNLESPTSIVGLGWQLPYEMIQLDIRNSVSPYDDAYYLSSTDGSQSQLRLTMQTESVWTFEAEDFDFSTILYYPKRQIWKITDSSGLTRIYGADVAAGDSPAALRNAIKWGGVDGNWTDSSVELGQLTFPISWNLARVCNQWGDEIQFTYSQFPDDTVQIGGPGGSYFTRASYLTKITDPAGHVVTFNYAAKIYNDVIREYEAPHVSPNPAGPYAFQDRYETRFIDSIDVSQKTAGEVHDLFAIRFAYVVQNLADPATPGEPRYLYKRYLAAITTVNADGKILPGLRFTYYDGSHPQAQADGLAIHRGAIESITFPDGGIATYRYTWQPVSSTSLDWTMQNSDPDWIPGVPRFWFAPDYLVITYYDEIDSNKLTVAVYDWNGQWLVSKPVVTNLPFSLDLSTLQVNLQDENFTVSFRLTGAGMNGALQTYAVRRSFGQYGRWEAVQLAMPDLLAPDAPYQVVTGRGFIVAAAMGVSQIYRYTWNPRLKQWVSNPLYVSTVLSGEWSLGAADNFFTLCQYQPGAPLSLSLYYYNLATLEWTDNLAPFDSIPTYVWQNDLPKLSWSLSDTFAAATYITSANSVQETFNYEVRIYQWDINFQIQQAPNPIVGTDIPAATLEPVAVSLADASLIGNVGNLRRFDGINWNSGSLGSFGAGGDVAQFAFGDDLAVGVNSERGVIGVYNAYQGVFNSVLLTAGSGGPAAPTINAPYVTVRNLIYQQMPTGELRLLNQQLPLDAVSISNQAPLFLAYGRADGSSFVWTMKNGVLAPNPQQVQGSMFPSNDGAGTDLTGAFAFATFTGVSFDSPSSITLQRVLFQSYSGPMHSFVVSSVAVTDGMSVTSGSVFDYNTPGATGTVSPYGLSTQFSCVKAAMGTTQAGAAPFGYSIYRYFDGMSPHPDSDKTAYSMLNGLLKEVDGYDSQGKQVARTSRSWDVVRTAVNPSTGTSGNLIGGYVRMSQSVETVFDVNPMSLPAQPPLDVATTLIYNDANGVPRTKQTQYYDATTGQLVQVQESYTFAYEKYPALAAPEVNQITASVAKTVTVGNTVTQIEATTWSTTNPGSTWAPYRRYRALSGSAAFTPGNWNNTTEPDPREWRRQWQITARDNRGEIAEYIAADGQSNSVITDTSQELVLVAAGNASVTRQQVVYLGFDPYEDLTGWTLAGSAANLPLAIRAGDSFTGSRALVMAGSAVANSSPLARSLPVTETVGRQYVLSCWFKTPTGFGALSGTADWTITGTTAGTVTANVPDTEGVWQSFFVLFDLAANASPQIITLTLTNTKNAAVKVDNLRVSPSRAGFTANVYSPALLLSTASIQSTSQTMRTVRGDFEELLANVDAEDTIASISDTYLSRRGNLGSFSAADPNSTLTITPREWAFYQSFNTGHIFDVNWSSSAQNKWSTGAGKLVHSAGAQDRIAFTGYPAASGGVNAFGASMRVMPSGPVTAATGVAINSGFQIAWSPQTAAWTLTDSSSNTTVTAGVRSLLDVSFATYTASLNTNVLPPDFLSLLPAAGLPLALGSTVTAITANAQWRISDAASALIYYLVRSQTDNTKIQVVAFPRQWTVVVVDKNLAFFADGGRVFSHRASMAPQRSFGLFATDEIAFDNALFFAGPQLQVSYLDGDARVRQELVVCATDTAPNQWTAKATIYDALGRDVIHTQGATLTPTAATWGCYENDLASFNWSTMTITGLVKTENAQSGGFPYWRTRYEDSPLGRKAESGLPGNEYAINPANSPARTTRYHYGLNNSSLGYAAGKYTQFTTVDPNGTTRLELTDERQSKVALAVLTNPGAHDPQWSITKQQFDAFANLVTSTSPMGWSDTFVYDYLGNATQANRANEGQTRSMYDSVGRLRFQMDARGAAASNSYIKYWKYDALSRVSEEGCSLQSWPGTLLQHVDDQSFPAAAPSNRYAYDFEFDGGNPSESMVAIGKLTQIVSASEVSLPGTTDQFSATECLHYDIWACLIKHSISFAGNPTTYTTNYTFNNQGEVIEISYPGATAMNVQYGLDSIGRVTSIGVDSRPCIVYTYDQNGKAATETMFASSGQQVGASRTLEYAPPGWLSETAGTEFTETTVYAPTNEGAPGYFDGSPTQTITAPRGSVGQITSSYAYDPQGRLQSVQVTAGAASAFSYDANGNIRQVGSATNSYQSSTKDLVQSTQELARLRTYQYDPAGEMHTRTSIDTPAVDLTLTWDCFRARALTAVMGPVGTQSTVNVRYGHRGRRVLKSVAAVANPASTLYYLRGAGDDSLVEISSTGTVRQYVMGPAGLVHFRQDGTEYFVSRDRLGSVRAVLDSSARLIVGRDYLPYGLDNGAAFGLNPGLLHYRYLARELDETGLYDFRARLYDALQARFLSADPERQFLSPYIYASNNPLLLTDPNGEWAFIPLLLAFLAEAAEAIAATVAASAEAIAATAGIGAGVGLVTGVVQSAEVISANNLSGAEAAGVFFGTVVLSTVGGGLSGGAAAVTGAFVEGVTLASAAAIAAGVVAQGAISAAQSAGQAALTGDDAGDAAWKNALAGGSSFLAGSLVTAGVGQVLQRATFSTLTGTTKSIITGATSGAAGGVVGSGVTAGLNDENAGLAFSDVLQGVAFGVLGGVFPEVVNYKLEKVARLHAQIQRRIGAAQRLSSDLDLFPL
ncbi:RHS repeat domain-containing protein [Paraburkholderia sp. RL18-085-BIA-A]|uniref:RHS repeat domain-containing protein n=1 Tax=Paraburkholderia sp. RL18-085-BIA-A TaxID=3031633 RepID=UPI0038B6C51F